MAGSASPTEQALATVVAGFGTSGEARPGQVRMAQAVAHAIDDERHVVVQAGTGTGKSLGYLVPAVLSGRTVVVATATKALQDQLVQRDLPFLAEQLGEHLAARLPDGGPLRWAMLKGRSNYVCRQRVHEVSAGPGGELLLDDATATVRREVSRLAIWASTTDTGDQAELDWNPSARAWATVSVSAMECPGAARCAMGSTCFAEQARRRADDAAVIVVNTHLYGLDVAAEGAILPEHDVVIFDEAHQLEDVIAATNGVSLGPGRFTNLARLVAGVIADHETLSRAFNGAADRLADGLRDHRGRRVAAPLPPEIAAPLLDGRGQVDGALAALRAVSTDHEETNQRKLRAQRAAGHLAGDIDLALVPGPDRVSWVDGPDHSPSLQVAAIDVGPILDAGVWSRRSAVLTSATIPPGLAERLALPAERTDVLDVGSPFDYATHGLLYCATHLPDPRNPRYAAALHDELEALIRAAGGRTLALFTSWKAMQAAADALRPRLPFDIITQADLPKPALIEAFRSSEERCLFATAGLFQGIDVPGASLSLVTIDRLPFPRPDDPMLQARRDRAGADAFRVIDIPRAATLLAQAAGRLIRSASDRGVVAVLDPRLNTATYRWDIIRALPPFRRTRHRADVEAFLAAAQR